MTGKEFKEEMQNCDGDPECGHMEGDDLLVKALRQLCAMLKDEKDWIAGLDAFEKMGKWYA